MWIGCAIHFSWNIQRLIILLIKQYQNNNAFGSNIVKRFLFWIFLATVRVISLRLNLQLFWNDIDCTLRGWRVLDTNQRTSLPSFLVLFLFVFFSLAYPNLEILLMLTNYDLASFFSLFRAFLYPLENAIDQIWINTLEYFSADRIATFWLLP